MLEEYVLALLIHTETTPRCLRSLLTKKKSGGLALLQPETLWELRNLCLKVQICCV